MQEHSVEKQNSVKHCESAAGQSVKLAIELEGEFRITKRQSLDRGLPFFPFLTSFLAKKNRLHAQLSENKTQVELKSDPALKLRCQHFRAVNSQSVKAFTTCYLIVLDLFSSTFSSIWVHIWCNFWCTFGCTGTLFRQ